MDEFKVISLFAGIGGICTGFKQAGYEVIWANELDRDACKTYRHNYKDIELIEGDISKIKSNQIPAFDILTAGFPCQAFSIAGYQKGFNDDRGNLFFEIVRILRNKKPKAFLLENVKNLKNHDNGNTFKIIEEQLNELGYHIKSRVLNSSEYGDIPQNRERIYIVGFKSKLTRDNFIFPKKINPTKTIHDIIDITDKKDKKYYYNKSKYYKTLKEAMTKKETIYQWRRVYVRENKSNLCPTLTANMGTGGHNVPLILDNFDIRKLTPQECIKFQGFPDSFTFPNEISASACYKQAGNSVVVPVIQRIAEEIKKVL